MTERWLPVVGYEGRYEVSDLGQVLSLPNSRRKSAIILKPAHARRGGYPMVCLSLAGSTRLICVHVLVARAFLGQRPDGHQVCHNDGCSKNVALTNLRYDTPAGNAADKLKHGTSNRGEAQSRSVLTVEIVREIKRLLASNTGAEVARQSGLSHSTIRNVSNGSRWGWVHV